MKITIAAVGKIKEKYLRDGINEYKKRLSRFCNVEEIEIDDEKAPPTLSPAQETQAVDKEGDRLVVRINPSSYKILLDVKGQAIDSECLAEKLSEIMQSGKSEITFMIGGSLGHGRAVVERADCSISISKMTFPHQLVRLILVEQIYRAFKINAGETYHK